MSSELTAKVEQLGKAVQALTEFNRDLHKAMSELKSPVVDLSQLKIPAPDLTSIENTLKALGEVLDEHSEKLDKIGEFLAHLAAPPVAVVDEDKKSNKTKG